MADELLTDRALNRATLQRQMLLERASMPVLDAVDHLVGLQAQIPHDPYLALWSRLDGFQPHELARALVDRKLVRIAVMRATIHLVTADDCLRLRPLIQPVLDAELAGRRDLAPALKDVDLGPIMDHAGSFLAAETPRSTKELRRLLAERFPELDSSALAYACRCLLALVQVPPRGLWGRGAQVTYATAESWLGRPLDAAASIEDMVVRYLAAFGPATSADVTTWCRLTGMREVVDRLRPRLRTFRDERGRELVDLPEAPRPDPATPAPTRFLPEYDNVLLSHADRSRIADKAEVAPLYDPDKLSIGHVLHDGRLRASWRLDRDRSSGSATLLVQHLPGLAKRAADSIAAEGRRVLRFLAADATEHTVRPVEVR
jgi:hypothetical protein